MSKIHVNEYIDKEISGVDLKTLLPELTKFYNEFTSKYKGLEPFIEIHEDWWGYEDMSLQLRTSRLETDEEWKNRLYREEEELRDEILKKEKKELLDKEIARLKEQKVNLDKEIKKISKQFTYD